MSWDWPEPTDSLALEALGYAEMQTMIRFAATERAPVTTRAQHRLMTECHRRGRRAWRRQHTLGHPFPDAFQRQGAWDDPETHRRVLTAFLNRPH